MKTVSVYEYMNISNINQIILCCVSEGVAASGVGTRFLFPPPPCSVVSQRLWNSLWMSAGVHSVSRTVPPETREPFLMPYIANAPATVHSTKYLEGAWGGGLIIACRRHFDFFRLQISTFSSAFLLGLDPPARISLHHRKDRSRPHPGPAVCKTNKQTRRKRGGASCFK